MGHVEEVTRRTQSKRAPRRNRPLKSHKHLLSTRIKEPDHSTSLHLPPTRVPVGSRLDSFRVQIRDILRETKGLSEERREDEFEDKRRITGSKVKSTFFVELMVTTISRVLRYWFMIPYH